MMVAAVEVDVGEFFLGGGENLTFEGPGRVLASPPVHIGARGREIPFSTSLLHDLDSGSQCKFPSSILD